MKNLDFVSFLANRFSDYVTFRCLGGVDPKRQIGPLRLFDRFLDQEGFQGQWPTPQVIERYVATTQHLHPGSRTNRFSVVRQFCRYLRQFEPQCFVPEKMLLRRPFYVPHIYSESQVKAILEAARRLPPVDSLRPKTYFTLFGLLYTTGLRCGESFALNLSDVDLEQNLLFIHEGKFGKSRWVPVSPSTSAVLQRYAKQRRRLAPALAESPFFVTRNGRRLYYKDVTRAFRQVLKRCGLRGGKGCAGPQIHHLRHSFACNRLVAWYHEGKDVQALLPALATYLGHVKVTSTQVYLQATAELLEEANQRFVNNFRQNVSPKRKNVMNITHPVARFVQGFFHDYLSALRGFSTNTILSYRDCLKLFLRFASQRVEKQVDKMILEDFDEKLVVAFLDDLEGTRNNSTQTRNNRLAALRAFFRYVAGQEPTVLARCQRICEIPAKRTVHKTIEYLDDKEMTSVLESVDQRSRNGLRDYALLMFFYNSGARVQEGVDLEIADVRLEAPLQVKLTGKGRKQRVCPLWPETVTAIRAYLDQRDPEASKVPSVFLNANGKPITRFGIRYIVRRYAAKAAEVCPSLKSKKVSPHSVRHTTAMHMLQSGNSTDVIKSWLGHADINTTHGYVEIDMKMKREALDACQPPQVKTGSSRKPKWQQPSILQWLDELSTASRNYVQRSTGPVAPTP